MTTCVKNFLRDQLVACLRESFPTPLGTSELIAMMPCDLSASVYRNLRALERQQVIGRAHIPGQSCVFWTYFPEDFVAKEIDMLERLWLM